MSHRKLAPILLVAALAAGAAASAGVGATTRTAAPTTQAKANGRILIESGTRQSKELIGLSLDEEFLDYGLYGGDFSGSYSPDGKRIALSASDGSDDEIYLMNADGTGLHQLTHSTSDDISPSWSPDGTQLAFASSRDGDFDIYTMRTGGTDVVNRTNAWSGDDLDPHWSPDGKWIGYVSTQSLNTRRFFVIPAAEPKLPPGDVIQKEPVDKFGTISYWFDGWSPDGTHFLLESDAYGSWDMLQYDTAASFEMYNPSWVVIAQTKSIETQGIYSPDGRKIAFSSNRSGSYQVYTINVDGTGLKQLTHTKGVDNLVVAWQPLEDTHTPTAHADPNVVKPGVRGALRFTAADDSRHVYAVAYVFAGKRLLACFRDTFVVGASSMTRSFAWRAPKTVKAPLKFCIEVRDPSGNESTRNCAPLRVQAA